MMTAKTLRTLLSISSAMLIATSAHAWDPSEGSADAQSQPFGTTRPSAPLPASVVPRRYYSNPYAAQPAPAPSTFVSAPAAAAPASSVTYYAPVQTGAIPASAPAQPAPIAGASYQPMGGAPAGVPIYNPPAPAYATPSDYAATAGTGATTATIAAQSFPDGQPEMAQAAPAPTYAPGYNYQPSADNYGYPAKTKRDRSSIGVEAFYDNYREPTATVNSNAYYGAFDAGWDHYYTPLWYSSLEGRLSYGEDDYKSTASGSVHGVPQWEYDLRLTGGYDVPLSNNNHFKTYGGLGSRYYRDEGKGEVTDLGAEAYDRRIFQLYAPLGMTYEFHAYGLTFAPNFEFDPLLYGNVSTRFTNVPGIVTNANFVQNIFNGYGLRGEFAISRMNANGTGWQISPFIRYWNIDDSQDQLISDRFGNTEDFEEPQNNRLQTGVKMKYLF
jgi:hypothetical protein